MTKRVGFTRREHDGRKVNIDAIRDKSSLPSAVREGR
jgi:hypothetical protein